MTCSEASSVVSVPCGSVRISVARGSRSRVSRCANETPSMYFGALQPRQLQEGWSCMKEGAQSGQQSGSAVPRSTFPTRAVVVVPGAMPGPRTAPGTWMSKS